MPMGIVTDEDFDKALNDVSRPASSPALPNAAVTIIERGRGTGNVEVPDSLRKIIGETAVTDGRQEAVALANNFGLSQSAASAYANGSRSTASYNDTPNRGVVNDAKVRVQSRARRKLMQALNKITDDKLDSTNAKDLSSIAKDMAAVIKVMEPESDKKDNGENKGGPQFIIYAPQFKKEENFEVVYAKE